MGALPEIVVVGAALAAACAVVVSATRGAVRARVAALAIGGVVTAISAAATRPPPRAQSPAARPRPTPALGYVSSRACRACHPAEHASFTRTFHRTMTQDATPAAALAPLDGRPLELDGRTLRLARRGDALYATLPDPDVVAEAALARLRGRSEPGPAPDRERRVVLTTGSHREQVYWVEGRRPGELRLFPFVWLVREARFVPRRDAFLAPEGAPTPPLRWNSNCIACHAVAGEPGHDPERDAFDTRVAELGIAYEACHGPGAEHAERHRDPVTRYLQHARKDGDRTIVNPRRLPPERAAAVCGQCHAYAFPRDEGEWWASGYARSFRAGDLLEASRALIVPAWLEQDAGGAAPSIEATAESLFWPDGTIRVGGREHNALVASPCYERGEGERKLTCTSCHAMHRGDPAGQIAPDRAGDAACTTCHAVSSDHAHHAPGSPGASCLGCHMPKTSYALYSAVRSHRIESPSAESTLRTGKPNACNLCHLDRSLAWTARWLSAWYGAPEVRVPDARARTSEGLYGGLAGDAAVRVLVADALGSPEAARAGGTRSQAPVLAELLDDPYAAVRFVAARSLRGLPGYGDLAVDFLAPPEARARARRDVLARFRERGGELDVAVVDALLAARDSRAITIAE